MAYYGLIPDIVPVVTSVTTLRPQLCETALGSYEFRHVKTPWFFGYHLVEVSPGQEAFLATPEKALLDLAYLHPGGDSLAYLRELRLQNLESLDQEALEHMAARAGKPKLRRVAAHVAGLARSQAQEYEAL